MRRVVDEMKMRGVCVCVWTGNGNEGDRELGRGSRRLHRMREGREVKTENARGDVDDRMKMHRGGGGGVEACCEEVGKRVWGLLEGRGICLHPAGVWSSLAPAAPSSQSPSLNQGEEQRYACY